MPDSFVDNPNMTKWPTVPGYYWFYGYRFGKVSCGREQEKELMLCRVIKISNGLMVVGNGTHVFRGEVEDALFIPATLPELPVGERITD